MPDLTISLEDSGFGDAARRLSSFDGNVIVTASVNEMAQALRSGGTPVDTGELVGSIRQEVRGGEGEVGYVKEYAPHVEYGHRQNVGQFVPKLGKRLKASYVPGQKFLQREVSVERPSFERRVGQALREEGL
jgi:hypothetical protein